MHKRSLRKRVHDLWGWTWERRQEKRPDWGVCIEIKEKQGFLVAQSVKNLPAMRETRLDPWVGKIPWRTEWLPTPIFLLGEFHGRRSLAGYSPWGRKGSDTTERLTLSLLFKGREKENYYVAVGAGRERSGVGRLKDKLYLGISEERPSDFTFWIQ